MIVPFRGKAHVLIESGRCTGGDTPYVIGHWVHMVALVDDEGDPLHDYIGTDRHAVDAAAVRLARDFACRIVDRSTEAPR